MITCFAVWARMRPKSVVSSFTPIWSPSSASGSSARAGAIRIWFSGSVRFSTTVRNSKSSISPSSSLKRASISFSWPYLRRAACFMASSSAPMMTRLSMPLSLAIWSISRFKPSMLCAPLVPRPREVGPRELVHPIRLADLREGDRHFLAVHRHRGDPRGEGQEPTPETPASGEGPPGLDLDLQPARRLEVLLPCQPPVQSRRGNLKPIAHRERVRRVNVRADLPRDVGAAVNRHLAVPERRVDRHAELPGPPAPHELRIHQLEPVGLHDGLDQGPKLLGDVPIHLSCAQKRKKRTKSPLFPAQTRVTYPNSWGIATAAQAPGSSRAPTK